MTLQQYTARELRGLRAKNNLTIEELAKATNISRVTLGNYEQEKNTPNIEFLSVLLDYYKVRPDIFFRGYGEND